MAWVGLALAVLLTLLLPVQLLWSPLASVYWYAHYCLYGVFFLNAWAGLALCSVGIRDGKRSAIWGLLAVLSLTLAAVVDTTIWLDLFDGPPFLPFGFIGFWILLAVGYARRPADAPQPTDRNEDSTEQANNLTRRSRSLPRKLLREGNIHLLPLYYLIYQSDLGREGIERSGSYQFADHIYRNIPSGQNALGRWIDARMLRSPATSAFRERYIQAREAMLKAVKSFGTGEESIGIMAVPCGLPRDLNELAETLRREDPALLAKIQYVGFDIDPELLKRAAEFTKDCPVPREFHQGNALERETYPTGKFHCVVSTGLNEFLKPEQLRDFQRNVFDCLIPGGLFFTSFTQREGSSEVLMTAFELHTEYHSRESLEQTVRDCPWSEVKIWPHESGLQLFMIARK
jgi:hypothetical protein